MAREATGALTLAIALTLLTVLAAGIALEWPIAVSLLVAGSTTILAFNLAGSFLAGIDVAAQQVFSAIDSFALLAIPFFILAGTLLGRSGVARRLVDLARALVGHRRGGLGAVTILGSMFFAGVSGSGPADVAAIGLVMVPALVAAGAPRSAAAALVGSAGGLGIVVPPSIALIVYGIITETSINRLFLAGIVPGILVSVALALVSGWVMPARDSADAAPRLGEALREAAPGLCAPIIILGGIYGGWFTATESAAIAVAYAVILDLIVYHEITPRILVEVLADTARAAATVLWIIACASVFAWALHAGDVTRAVTEWLLGFAGTPLRALVVANAVLIVGGCILDAISLYYLLLPMLFPVVVETGVDPVHFGIVTAVNLAIGQATPPVGVNLFVAARIGGIELGPLSRASLPYLAAWIAALGILSAFPAFSLALPDLLGAR